MNPVGIIPIVVGILLVAMAVSGKYRQAWEIITGQPVPGTAPTRTA